MRPLGLLAVAAALLALALPALPAQAQAVVVEDPSGDVAVGPEGAPGGVPGPWDVDIVAVAVAESVQAFDLTVELARLDEPKLAPTDIDLFFTSSGAGFWVQLIAPASIGGAGAVYRADGDAWAFLDVVDVGRSGPSGSAWTATVPKVLLVSDDGAPPTAGDALTAFWASARAFGSKAGDVETALRDRAPDEGTTGSFGVALGDAPRGGARLFSTTPSRVSNGEEATFAYPVVLQNNGDAARDFVLEVARQPASWVLDLPTTVAHLEPGESLSSYVFVSTPFAHQHGRLETVDLRLRSVDGQAEDGLTLYLLYHPVPQPTGHHNTLWMHVDDSGQSPVNQLAWNSGGATLYMNTLEQDEQDSGTGALGRATAVAGEGYGWDYVLRPLLRTGLDFDVGHAGHLSLHLSSPVPVTDGAFGGRLVLLGGTETTLATLTEVTGLDLEPGVPTPLELDLVPTPEADFVPYTGSVPILLELELRAGRPTTYLVPESPSVLPGATLTLPLLEYRDPLDHKVLEVPDNALAVEGAAQKRIAPGGTAVFTVLPGPGVDGYALAGTNEGWAEVVAGTDGKAYVIVEAPATAAALQTVDLVVKAYDGDGVVGLARVIATIGHGGTTDDAEFAAAVRAAPGQDAPGLPLAALVLALVAVLALRRRDG